MDPTLIVALISGGVALVSAAVSVWGGTRTTRLSAQLKDVQRAEARRAEREKTTARYREPLARAAYDLQSRLYNILEQNLLSYVHTGDDRERSYVVDNTAFLLAQYFAWTEIVRRDIQYIDLGLDEETRRLARLQDDISSVCQMDRLGRIFRVFAGEQRALGERMIVRDGRRRLECLGYAAYLEHIARGSDLLTDRLREDVRAMSARPDEARPRLVTMQHALIDLLAFLDPRFVRFPEDRRTKAPLSF